MRCHPYQSWPIRGLAPSISTDFPLRFRPPLNKAVAKNAFSKSPSTLVSGYCAARGLAPASKPNRSRHGLSRPNAIGCAMGNGGSARSASGRRCHSPRRVTPSRRIPSPRISGLATNANEMPGKLVALFVLVVIFEADDQLTDVASAQDADKGFGRPLQTIDEVLKKRMRLWHCQGWACRGLLLLVQCSARNSLLPHQEGQPMPNRWRRFEVVIPLRWNDG
jgi:hypothetical protein